jgi:hypothetical protein
MIHRKLEHSARCIIDERAGRPEKSFCNHGTRSALCVRCWPVGQVLNEKLLFSFLKPLDTFSRCYYLIFPRCELSERIVGSEPENFFFSSVNSGGGSVSGGMGNSSRFFLLFQSFSSGKENSQKIFLPAFDPPRLC